MPIDVNQVPRRNRLDLNTEAELSIYRAMQEVEKVGADEKLTEVTILLDKAKNILGDYVDALENAEIINDKK